MKSEQWQLACNSFDTLTDNITTTVLETCRATPIPTLPTHIAKQDRYLPKKSQKQWKLNLSTYHLIRKTIYIIKNNPNWCTHPFVTHELINHTHTTIPPPSDPSLEYNSWITTLATIAKETKHKARKITSHYTNTQIKKAISKYQQLYKKSPKKINRKIFKSNDNPSLDCLIDRYDNILTNQPISHKRYISNNQLVKDPPSQHATINPTTHHNAYVELDNIRGTT